MSQPASQQTCAPTRRPTTPSTVIHPRPCAKFSERHPTKFEQNRTNPNAADRKKLKKLKEPETLITRSLALDRRSCLSRPMRKNSAENLNVAKGIHSRTSTWKCNKP